MKKFAVIGLAIGLVVAAILLSWQHFKSSHDESVRKLLAGAWTLDGSSSYTARPDGTFVRVFTNFNTGRVVTNEGTFQVKDGFIFETVTKSSRTNTHVPITSHSWIIRAEANQIVVIDGDPGGNVQHIFRRETR